MNTFKITYIYLIYFYNNQKINFIDNIIWLSGSIMLEKDDLFNVSRSESEKSITKIGKLK